MSDCTCRPGVESTGWREIRCKKCLQAELAEWSRIMRLAPKP